MTGGMGNTVSQNHQRHYFEYTVVRFLFLRANGTYRLSSICSFDVKGDNAKVRIGENRETAYSCIGPCAKKMQDKGLSGGNWNQDSVTLKICLWLILSVH